MYHIRFIRHLCNLHGMSQGQEPGRQPKKAGSHIAGEPADDTWTERGPQAVRRARAIFSAPKSRVRPGRNI